MEQRGGRASPRVEVPPSPSPSLVALFLSESCGFEDANCLGASVSPQELECCEAPGWGSRGWWTSPRLFPTISERAAGSFFERGRKSPMG
jgi:hypothetical protein